MLKSLKIKAQPQTIETQITYKGQVIPLTVKTSKRRTFSIVVYPNSEVVVKAPLRVNIESLLEKVEKKGDWVLKHLKKFENLPKKSQPKTYQDGEEFSFLGRKHNLKLIKSNHTKIEMQGDELVIKAKNISPASIKTILKFWYNEQATTIFSERLEKFAEQLHELKLPKYSKLVIKKMKSRWGSCGPDRVITLNPELLAAPLECVDYVIIHELCHLRELNHSPRYYKLLSQALPHWKVLKTELNRTVGTGFL